MKQNTPVAATRPGREDRASELSELAANLQSIAESEKVLLARQLHDELGGALVGAKMDMAWLRRRVASSEPEVVARWERLERALETSIAFKRRMVEQLRPTLLDNLGFYAAARWLVEETCAAAGLKAQLDLALPEPLLSKEVGIALFRVLQQALLNVTHHAQASLVSVAVSVETSGNALRLRVADDGVGLSADRLKNLGSRGLGIMRHRTQASGGRFWVHSVAGQGTEIVVVVPVLAAPWAGEPVRNGELVPAS